MTSPTSNKASSRTDMVDSHNALQPTSPWLSFPRPTQYQLSLELVYRTLEHVYKSMDYRIGVQEKLHDELDKRVDGFGTEISNAVEHESLRVDSHANHLYQIQNEVDTMDRDDRRLRQLLENRFQKMDQDGQEQLRQTEAKLESLEMKLKEHEAMCKRMEELEARLDRLAACGIRDEPGHKSYIHVAVENMKLEDQD